MVLKRKDHWAERAFHAFLLERARMPFAWGGNDCALFAADAVEAITGEDIAGEFRGKYDDARGAFATIKTVSGGSTVADAAAWCAKRYGLVEGANPLMAQRGDLVVLEDAGRLVAGVVGLNGHPAIVGDAGLLQRPITDVKRVWHY